MTSSQSLYRSVLGNNSQNVINGSTPNNSINRKKHRDLLVMEASPGGAVLSPVSSLALDLNFARLHDATAVGSNGGSMTPFRRLAVSASAGGNNGNCCISNGDHNSSSNSSGSYNNVTCSSTSLEGVTPRSLSLSLNNSKSGSGVSSLSCQSYPPERKQKATRFAQHLSCSFTDSIQESASAVLGEYEILPSPTSSSPPSCHTTVSPDADKENNLCLFGTPKEKPFLSLHSSSSSTAGRQSLSCRSRRRSPLKDIANVSRSLNFSSPAKKALTPAKRPRPSADSLREETSPLEPDASSRDSGYSESATKCEDGRLCESVACAPRKLVLDTPNKHNPKSTAITAMPTIIAKSNSSSCSTASCSQTTTCIASSSSLLSEKSNLRATSSSTSCVRGKKSMDGGTLLSCYVTQTNTVVDHDEDLYMKELESMEQEEEASNRRRLEKLVEGDEDGFGILDSPVPELGALLSGPVMDMSIVSSSSDRHDVLSSVFGSSFDNVDVALNVSSASSLGSSVAEVSPSTCAGDRAAKKLFVHDDSDSDSSTASSRSGRAPFSGNSVNILENSRGVPLQRRETLNLSLSPSSDDNAHSGAVSCSETAARPCLMTPTAGNQGSIGGRRRVGSCLASSMDVSPLNPQSRPPIRRALSLFAAASSLTSSNTNFSEAAHRKIVLSPNCAFKRPLPPAEVSPFMEPKRHKSVAVGGTPQLPGGRSNSLVFTTVEGLPVMVLDDPSSPCPVQTLAQSSPTAIPTIPTEHLQSDASPELPLSRHSSIDSALAPSSSEGLCQVVEAQQQPASYNLGPRQYSAPIAALSTAGVGGVNATAGMFGSSRVFNPVLDKEPLCRALSESHLSIMKALSKSQHHEEQLTGDFSHPVCLPVITSGRHPEFQTITPETMESVIRGGYKDVVKSYEILDCRYPYEYDGGHIVGAANWHNPQFVVDHIEKAENEVGSPSMTAPNARHILIFHCEFSAERGPRAQRLLRERDRTVNKDRYPSLHYPETYLLEGGYRAFFEQYPELCTPKKYTKMLDPEHSENLKLCRNLSKVWAVENKQSKGRTGLRGKRYN